MKGIGPLIAIAAVAVAALLVAEGVYFNVFIGQSVDKEELAKELEVIKAVNKVEAVKRGLPYALYYSFSQAAYKVLKTGGYSSLENVETVGSIPVWKNKDETSYPNYASNISFQTSYIFGEYTRSSEEVKIPEGETEIEFLEDRIKLKFSSSGLLSYEFELVKVNDNPNTTTEVKTKIEKMFELGKQIAESITCDESKSYDKDDLNIEIEKIDNSVLVKIEDPENAFPVYDGQQLYKNLVLQFYVSC
jgi:hypothetical protein